jgi:hypothetical protein
MVTALLSLLWPRSLECRLDCLEQAGRDLGEDAKPGLERKSRLVEQQAEPIDRDAAAPLKVNYLYFLSICLGCGNGVTAFAGCSI